MNRIGEICGAFLALLGLIGAAQEAAMNGPTAVAGLALACALFYGAVAACCRGHRRLEA